MIHNPYGDNILISGLGEIPDHFELLNHLTDLPELPLSSSELAAIPRHIRLHYLHNIRELYLPSPEGSKVAETIDYMLRAGYKSRNPVSADSWKLISKDNHLYNEIHSPCIASVVVGHAGTGKTQTIQRALSRYPQIIIHDNFPQLIGKHLQVSWLSLDIPASGKSRDIARELCSAWDNMLSHHFPEQPRRFQKSLSFNNPNPQKLFDEWKQVAKSHFLGILHLDEVQNLFKLSTLEKRRSKSKTQYTEHDEGPELSIVEDQSIRWILEITNQWKIPVLISGTPDGVRAVMKRFSNAGRFSTTGYHLLPTFSYASESDSEYEDEVFTKTFLPILLDYQWLEKRLEDTPELRKKICEYSAGIPRLIIALWFVAQRIALSRSDSDEFRLEDLDQAIDGPLALIKPAVSALRSGIPEQMRAYEDLIEIDPNFWGTVWSTDLD